MPKQVEIHVIESEKEILKVQGSIKSTLVQSRLKALLLTHVAHKKPKKLIYAALGIDNS